jgi:hypothetical protein
MRANRIKKKLEKKVIGLLGENLVVRRNQIDNTTDGLDMYGEPTEPSTYTNYAEEEIRFFIDKVGFDESNSSIGGISDKSRERILVYCSSDTTINIGDHILYPYGGTIEYEVEQISPERYKDISIYLEITAYRVISTT